MLILLAGCAKPWICCPQHQPGQRPTSEKSVVVVGHLDDSAVLCNFCDVTVLAVASSELINIFSS